MIQRTVALTAMTILWTNVDKPEITDRGHKDVSAVGTLRKHVNILTGSPASTCNLYITFPINTQAWQSLSSPPLSGKAGTTELLQATCWYLSGGTTSNKAQHMPTTALGAHCHPDSSWSPQSRKNEAHGPSLHPLLQKGRPRSPGQCACTPERETGARTDEEKARTEAGH